MGFYSCRSYLLNNTAIFAAIIPHSMKKLPLIVFATALFFSMVSCSKDEPKVIFRFKFDPTQERLDNLGQPTTVPPDHRAQNPQFNRISAHYIELAPSMYTALGGGKVLYKATETTAGGPTAIDFDLSKKVAEGEEFFSYPISEIPAGTYEWIRVSLAYQDYDINYRVNTPALYDGTGTLASFIGYNTYISTYSLGTQSVTVNANRLQGYWGFETLGYVATGQAPPGATTVPNPLFATSPIPSGSCVVTGQFASPLTITGNETSDIVITLSLSTNNSFEWKEYAGNNYYEPMDGDTVVDMGIRGLIPIIE